MFLRRFFKGIPKAEAHPILSSLENDETPTSSNVTAAPTHNLPGRDSVRLPESSHLGTLDIAEAFQVATANYSKRLSNRFKVFPTSHLCEFCQYTTGSMVMMELFPQRYLSALVILS